MVAPLTIGPGIQIGPGIGIGSGGGPIANLVLSLDAGNPASYPGSGATWTDTIGSMPFTLVNSPTYNSGNGGSLVFDPGAGQYAQCSSSLASLSTWSVEAWHYYTGTNTGASPCIVTELYPGSTGEINYFLGALDSSTTNLEAGYFNGGFQITPGGYTLTAGNWI